MNTLRDLKKLRFAHVHHDQQGSNYDQVLLVNRSDCFCPTKEKNLTQANLKEAYGNRLFFNGGDLWLQNLSDGLQNSISYKMPW